MRLFFCRRNNFICFLLALSVTALSITEGSVLPVFADETKETTSEKIQKAEELKKITEEQRQVIEEQKEDLEEQKEELKGYLERLNGNLEKISENIEELEAMAAVKEAEISEVQERIAAASVREKEQYELMKKRLRNVYESGNESFLTKILNTKVYNDFINKAEYVAQMEAYDVKVFEELSSIRKSIEKEEAELEKDMDELNVLMQQSEEELTKVNALVSTTSGSIAATTGAISAAEMEQAAYEAELKAQEKNLADLKKQLADEKAMSEKASKMSWRDVSQVRFEVSDRDLLAALIYCEAGSEPYIGQVAVGAVVINRIRSAAYPNTMVGVIYQKGQFSPVASGRLATRLSLGANESCYRAADEALAGSTPVGNCLYFRRATPQINGQIIGNHVFY